MVPEEGKMTDLERMLVEGLERFADDLAAGVEIEKKYVVRRLAPDRESRNGPAEQDDD